MSIVVVVVVVLYLITQYLSVPKYYVYIACKT